VAGQCHQILSAFNLDKYEFGVLTIEHNFEPQREHIFKLLGEKGYVRKFEDLSQVDD
jgi:hypothetical protein